MVAKNYRFWVTVCGGMFFALLLSCTPPSPYRTYAEKQLTPTDTAPSITKSNDVLDEILMDALYASGLDWTIPSEWEESPSSGIRFASFRSLASEAELVVVGFPGEVGTLQANVERWLRQMNAQITTPQLLVYLSGLDPLTNRQGVSYVKVDLSEFADRGSSTSIVTAILKFRDQSIFLKMQDERRKLEREQENFDAFIASLTLGGKS